MAVSRQRGRRRLASAGAAPGSGDRAGLYAQDEWRIGAALTSTLGLRMDRNNVTGTQINPRAALIWAAAPSKRQSIDGAGLAGYGLSNLNLLADQWARGLEVSLHIHNLFDRRYQHPAAETNWQDALVQDGRSARIKLDYRF